MTRPLDPDRSPPPRFWPFPIDIDTEVCDRCSAMVPATDPARQNHSDHHAQIDRLTWAVSTFVLHPASYVPKLSGSGSRTVTSTGATADASPDPDPKSPPTPVEKASDEAGPAGAEGSNDGTQADAAAGTSLGDVTPPPAVFPPAAGGTKGSRPVAKPGEGATGRLLSLAPPPDYGKWAR